MNRFFITNFLLCCFTIMLTSAQAQNDPWCGTPPERSKWLENYLQNASAYPKSNDLIYVPITVQVIGTDDGEGYASVRSILNALCTLNEDFATANIQFYMQGDIRYRNNSNYYDHASTSLGRQIANQYNVSNTINCYIVNNAGGDGVGGYAPFSGNYLVLRRSTLTNGNRTLSHEMGHSLSLRHTFHGWEDYEHDYLQNAPDIVYGKHTLEGHPVERSDRSNCDNAGDGFCDTPNDYLSQPWECDAGLMSRITQNDPTGVNFKSDGRNIMSYSACNDRFSQDQINAMRANLQDVKRSIINRAQPIAVVDSLVTILQAPVNSASVVFNSVSLQWNALPTATQYLIEVSRSANFPSTLVTSYVTKDNRIVITDLTNNRSYFWRVKAISAFNFCSNYSASGKFTTTTTTPVTVLNDKTSFNIYPNLLTNNQNITIEATLENAMPLQVRLIDMSGKLLQSTVYQAISGVNNLRFEPNNLPKGMYLLNITTEVGSVIEKIVIQ